MESNSTLVKIESPQIQTSLLSTGWNLPAQITEDDWKLAGSFLMQVNQARQWWLGDWWNACKWGDGKAACEEIGVDYQTATDCGWVASSFQISRRREILTFSHHRIIGGFFAGNPAVLGANLSMKQIEHKKDKPEE